MSIPTWICITVHSKNPSKLTNRNPKTMMLHRCCSLRQRQQLLLLQKQQQQFLHGCSLWCRRRAITTQLSTTLQLLKQSPSTTTAATTSLSLPFSSHSLGSSSSSSSTLAQSFSHCHPQPLHAVHALQQQQQQQRQRQWKKSSTQLQQQRFFHSTVVKSAEQEEEADNDNLSPAERKKALKKAAKAKQQQQDEAQEPPTESNGGDEDKAPSNEASATATTATVDEEENTLTPPDWDKHEPWQNPRHATTKEPPKVFEEDFADSDKEMEALPLMHLSQKENGYPPHIEELANELLHLNMMEMNELIQKLSGYFGVDMSSSGVHGGGDNNQQEQQEQEEQQEGPKTWSVSLVSFDAKSKIKVIKEVRSVVPDLGLKEAKAVVESVPKTILTDLSDQQEATAIQEKLQQAGAVVELVAN